MIMPPLLFKLRSNEGKVYLCNSDYLVIAFLEQMLETTEM